MRDKISGEAWDLWVALNYRFGSEKTLRGMADHLLCVGQKLG